MCAVVCGSPARVDLGVRRRPWRRCRSCGPLQVFFSPARDSLDGYLSEGLYRKAPPYWREKCSAPSSNQVRTTGLSSLQYGFKSRRGHSSEWVLHHNAGGTPSRMRNLGIASSVPKSTLIDGRFPRDLASFLDSWAHVFWLFLLRRTTPFCSSLSAALSGPTTCSHSSRTSCAESGSRPNACRKWWPTTTASAA